jgi:hypothetical protein
VIRDQGNGACAYCHQPVYCARCHAEKVLPVTAPFITQPQGSVPAGLGWRLVAAVPADGPPTGARAPAHDPPTAAVP